ncbi:hypothetical protein Trydic_g15820 [Trypoxylus dichotomus]
MINRRRRRYDEVEVEMAMEEENFLSEMGSVQIIREGSFDFVRFADKKLSLEGCRDTTPNEEKASHPYTNKKISTEYIRTQITSSYSCVFGVLGTPPQCKTSAPYKGSK